MHIPDGFIADPLIWGGCFLLTAPVLWWAGRQLSDIDGSRGSILLPGMTGAFVFAAQMFNFPVVAGTSSHMVGGMLACMLLGAGPGILMMTLVLALQCLLFQDGGLTALGANVLNMAVLAGGGGYGLFRLFSPWLKRGSMRWLALGAAAAAGILLSAAAVALEIGLGGVVPVSTAMTAMLVVHVPIAAVEGLATVSIVRALEQLRPDLVPGLQLSPARPLILPLAASGALLMVGAVLFASPSPDGLEYVAETLGFAGAARSIVPAPLPDYTLPGWAGLPGQLLAAVIGLLGVLLCGYVLAQWLRRRRELLDG